MTIGPSIMQFPSRIHVCTLCDFFESKLIKSGRNPEYQYRCHHQKWKDEASKYRIYGDYRVIGDNHTHRYSEAPMWCPVLFEKHKQLRSKNETPKEKKPGETRREYAIK